VLDGTEIAALVISRRADVLRVGDVILGFNVVLFLAAMSALGGAAQSETWLIASRTLMGVGGALMWPAILGMTYALLPDSKAGLAGGLILGTAGLGNALGPLIGGVLAAFAYDAIARPRVVEEEPPQGTEGDVRGRRVTPEPAGAATGRQGTEGDVAGRRL